MKDKIDISVVMGVYNAAAVLPSTLESILSQEEVAFEFIIVNDGSKDASGQMLEEFAKSDSRMRIIHQENRGLTKALIRGCSEARGEYIARQDAGDISLPDRLKLQKAALEMDQDLSFVSCVTEFCGPEWEHLFWAEGNGLAAAPVGIISDEHDKGVIDGPTHHGSVMFRRLDYERAGGYRQQFYVAQDWDLWYRLAEIGKFRILSQPLYRARLSPGSISALQMKQQNNAGGLAREALRLRRKRMPDMPVLEKAARILPEKTFLPIRKRDAAWFYFIGECLRRNDDSRAFSYLKKSILTNPFSVKPWIRMLQCISFLFYKRVSRADTAA